MVAPGCGRFSRQGSTAVHQELQHVGDAHFGFHLARQAPTAPDTESVQQDRAVPRKHVCSLLPLPSVRRVSCVIGVVVDNTQSSQLALTPIVTPIACFSQVDRVQPA